MTLGSVTVDLHLHTVLSPCADLEMGAPAIVAKALSEGIGIMAVTDHNSCLNYPALAGAAEGSPLKIVPGMEIQTVEDVHVVALFHDYDSALACQAWVWETLPDVPNREDLFGYQVVIDKDDGVVEMVPRLLVQGTGRTVDQVIAMVHGLGGLVILAHVDRPAFSYPAVLGFIPEDIDVDGIEVSARAGERERKEWRDRCPGLTVVRSSDAHRLSEISADRGTPMLLGDLSLAEVRLALKGLEGRRVLW